MEKYIEHHGIVGQKWGVRRYQNADGSYTAAGKARRGSRYSETLREARTKDISTLSTKELKDYNDRLRTEQEFERLRKDNVTKGREWIFKNANTIATAVITGVAIEAGKKWLKNRF